MSGDPREPAGIAGKEMRERSECIERNSGKGQENVAEENCRMRFGELDISKSWWT